MSAKPKSLRSLAALSLGALGVVYGDIGTSPLYALKECFYGLHAVPPTRENVLGVLSLIFWSLILIVTMKYLALVMRADNQGEGGILALMALAFPEQEAGRRNRTRRIFILMGVFGAALLYGDGMITPAISVLSAVEGLKVATPLFEPYVIPITVIVLVGLFSFQSSGTGKVGKVFGPIMLLWFATIAILGVRGIVLAPGVLWSLNPAHGWRFLAANGHSGFLVLGAVFLAVTGAEALYADMGHFGRGPIRRAWFVLILPALVLNYLGEGAFLLVSPAAVVNPFYNLAPSFALYPLVILATAATVIASQALISGVFSLTMQAIQLGYCPRLKIEHTSPAEPGQIYLPQINWALMLACLTLVVGFQSSSHLAAAYGIAISLTMLMTTILLFFAAQRLWNWSALNAALVCFPFFVIELAFSAANLLKVKHGGWVPLVVGLCIFTLLSTWKTGRKILRDRLGESLVPLREFLDGLQRHAPARVSGTAVFLSASTTGTPIALMHNLKHNKVLHQRVIVLTIHNHGVPRIAPEQRVTTEPLPLNFCRVTGHYGFMEAPRVLELLEACQAHNLEFRPQETSYFLSRETIIPSVRPNMAIWRERLFAFLARNAQPATAFFGLPANRVVELGMQIEI